MSNAVERIAISDAYDPTNDQHPTLATIQDLNARLRLSPYPEASETEDDDTFMGWGNWDVRVFAASAAMRLAQRFGATHPALLDEVDIFLRDPIRTVRLQITQSLNALRDVDRDRTWALAEHVATTEASKGVLAFFIGGPLQRLAGADAARAERLLASVLDRISVNEPGARAAPNDFFEATGNLLTWLCVTADLAPAWGRLQTWTDNLVEGDQFLWASLSSLRAVLFFGYQSPAQPRDIEMRGRAKRIVAQIVAAAVQAKATAEPLLRSGQLSDMERGPVEATFVAGERMLDHACNQFYFGSGAFRHAADNDAPGLTNNDDKLAFLQDYGGLLDQIGQHGSAQGIHHLIELYVFLAESSPADVFDRVASIITGQAIAENYQFESLGADLLVSLVRVYLADHRGIFESVMRRANLVAVLEKFSAAGWPEALKLLYELPDLLR